MSVSEHFGYYVVSTSTERIVAYNLALYYMEVRPIGWEVNQIYAPSQDSEERPVWCYVGDHKGVVTMKAVYKRMYKAVTENKPLRSGCYECAVRQGVIEGHATRADDYIITLRK